MFVVFLNRDVFDILGCPKGYTREHLKFSDTPKTHLKMENYFIDDCAKACTEYKNCNLLYYTLDFDKETGRKRGVVCYLYYEPDETDRTTPIDSSIDIFCQNKHH